MLQGHVFHSFAHKDLRSNGPYVWSQFFGGLTPAVFLFLTGVTLGFLMDSKSSKEPSGWRRILATVHRARYLLLIGLLFRVQLWFTSFGQSEWQNIFKVDILNCMAAAALLLAPLALLDTRARVWAASLGGLFVAGLAPLVSAAGLTALHPFLRHYLVPDPNFFPIFPWGAFVAFGLGAGSLLRLAPDADLPGLMKRAAIGGAVLAVAALAAASLPIRLYASSDFWLNSPALILIKTGIILLIASTAFYLTSRWKPGHWSPIRQLGTTSLLVYWVHTEVVYGTSLGAWKETLSVPQTILMAVFVIASMVLLSVASTGWRGFPGVPALFSEWRASLGAPLPQATAGD